MNWGRKILATFAGVALAVLLAGPAVAAMPSNAPRNYVTLWENIGYSGAAYPISDDWTGCRSVPSWFNDLAESVANNSASPARNIRFYKDGGCSGTSWLYYAGTYNGAMATSEGARQITSYRFTN